jgi:uncharacterized membrane protein YphA (DoxX/SURF4 family)
MDWLSVTARLLLAAIFLVAAIAKGLDQSGTRATLVSFGVRGRVATFAALLPAAELACAVALVLTPTAKAGAVGAALLLAIFTIAVIGALRRGEAPDCHCFGQASSSPVDRTTVTRNVVLLAVAVAAVAADTVPIPVWLGERTTPELVAYASVWWAALATSGFLLERRETAKLDLEVERFRVMLAAGLPTGTPLPNPPLEQVSGTVTPLHQAAGEDHAILFFLGRGCPACHDLMPAVSRWRDALPSELRFVFIGLGTRDEIENLQADFGLEGMLAMDAADANKTFGVVVTPTAIPVAPGLQVGGPGAEGSSAIESAVRQTLSRAASTGSQALAAG